MSEINGSASRAAALVNGPSGATMRERLDAITEIRVRDPEAIRRAADAQRQGVTGSRRRSADDHRL